MKHKILLALFLCLVIIFSQNIVSIDQYRTVEVRRTSSNIDEICVERLYEKNENYNIEVYYPMTKNENVNERILEKINSLTESVKQSNYISNKKYLKTSFDQFEYDGIVSLKLNIKYNVGLIHDEEEIYTINFIDDVIIDMEYIKNNEKELYENIKDMIYKKIIDDYGIDDAEIAEIVDNIINNLNFTFVNGKMITYFNKSYVSGEKQDYIEIEIPLN